MNRRPRISLFIKFYRHSMLDRNRHGASGACKVASNEEES